MTHWIFLMSTLAVAYCRPQIVPQQSPAVEIEKQEVVEITPQPRELFDDSKTPDLAQRKLEENTKEILEKIALVNEKQGLNKKKPRPYQHFSFGYLRSQNPENRQRSDFKFPRDPFTNPILDYIERKNSGIESNKRTPVAGYINKEPSPEEDDVPLGQYVKRKIVHQQSWLVPNPGYNPNMGQYFQAMNRNPGYGGYGQYPENSMKKNDLEKQTVNNIKNIVENSQYGSNQYWQPFNQYAPQQQPIDNSYRVYGPYTTEELYRPGRQWQWPLAQYFPIVIKDPLLHMMNAVTTMIEYGPQAMSGGANSCAKNAPEKETKARNIPKDSKLTYSITDTDNGAEITVENSDDSNTTTTLDIEDLQITDNKENPVKLSLNLRQSKQNRETTNSSETSRQSPPIRDQILYDDEAIDKAEDVQVSHDGNKKLFSKDNTGSGIFVHKIKVRKGGVAIAGPGGIATAGSGGTAIVGPNGFAYTHPDSLAIAGSGTKVVAVEPTINLAQVVAQHNYNKTRGQGHIPSRVGKIVAVGPVIYYNRG